MGGGGGAFFKEILTQGWEIEKKGIDIPALISNPSWFWRSSLFILLYVLGLINMLIRL